MRWSRILTGAAVAALLLPAVAVQAQQALAPKVPPPQHSGSAPPAAIAPVATPATTVPLAPTAPSVPAAARFH